MTALRWLRTLRLTLELLLGRRLALFLLLDLFLLLKAFLSMLLDTEGNAADLYLGVVLVPFLVLGPFALSGLVELERRAGCLDLALSSPSSEGYFLRRAGSVCAFLCAQGWLVMFLAWALTTTGRRFPLLPVLVQIALVSAFLGAVALFWAVRLASAGGVWLASVATVAALSRWFFNNPLPDRLFGSYNAWIFGAHEALAWLPAVGVLAASSLVLFLYARRRLRRPESLIS